MKLKPLLAATLVCASTMTALPALANYDNTQTLSVDNQNLRVAETAIRVLGNADGSGPLLVDDITDGLGQKQAGYKFMVMSRTYSTAAETRPPKEGADPTIWRDTVTVHRGTKLTIGVPVVNGEMDLNNAKLLNMAVVSDLDKPKGLQEGQVILPSGEQLVTKDAKISQPTFKLTKLQLPTYTNGEGHGGGIALEVSAQIDGKQVVTKVDNNFDRSYMTAERTAGAYKADTRFIKSAR